MITLAMSGGVDSSAAALLLLRDSGDSVRGVTFLMHDGAGASSAADAAAAVCAALGIPHGVLDARDTFRAAVIDDFIAEYARGRTPNPCVTCNRTVKFPLLLSAADQIAPDSRVSTGHYARITRCGSRLAVARAADPAKDQSYMLWQLPQQTLARLVLPLGAYTKPQIREIAREAGLPTASASDSQDICFIPDGDYAAFLAESGLPLPPGIFTDEEGNPLGPAKNQACYTVGQRRGLGIALGHHMYVTRRDAASNRIVISPRDPHTAAVRADQIRYMAAAPGDLDQPRKLTVRLRYARGELPCTAQVQDGILNVTPDSPARAPAPGQSLVLYDGDTVVAGGIICP